MKNHANTQVADDIGSVTHAWTIAVSQWFDGNPSLLAAAIRDVSVSLESAEVRELLASIVEGSAKNRLSSGRPDERHGFVERAIAYDVFVEWERLEQTPVRARRGTGSPKDAACDVVAHNRGLTHGAVRGVVDKVARERLTFAEWKKLGRPMFSDKKLR